MMLRYWDPFRDLRWMHRHGDPLWRDFASDNVERWGVPLDVVQGEESILVHASLPGISPEEVQVTIEENVLTIKGQSRVEREDKEGEYLVRERRTGSFHRTLRLPDSVDTEKARSTYEDGVLTITLPKVEAKKAKQLKVEVTRALEGKKS